jgi:outer membrane lipoprotein LolB
VTQNRDPGAAPWRKGSGRSFLVLVCAVLCASCAVPTPRPTDTQIQQLWQAHLAALQPVEHWELHGRLAVSADERGGQATFLWQRNRTQYSIRLSGPLGRGAVQVTQNELGATLKDAEQRQFHAMNAEDLLRRHTGWALPLSHLNYWVRGIPVPNLPKTQEWDDNGRLKVLRQHGWELRYEEYVRVGSYELPRRFTASTLKDQAGARQPAIEARLVIDRWAQVQ